MKKAILIYGSRYGTTKSYAQELSQRTGLPLISYKEAKSLDGYETIVYLGALFAGGVYGLAKVLRLLSPPQRLLLVTVGLADPADLAYTQSLQEHLLGQLPEEIRDHTRFFALRGGIDSPSLSLGHKLMIKAVYPRAVRLPEEKKTAEVKALVETYGKTVSYVDFSTLEPLVIYLSESKGEDAP